MVAQLTIHKGGAAVQQEMCEGIQPKAASLLHGDLDEAAGAPAGPTDARVLDAGGEERTLGS
jgi:hypothetical protein